MSVTISRKVVRYETQIFNFVDLDNSFFQIALDGDSLVVCVKLKELQLELDGDVGNPSGTFNKVTARISMSEEDYDLLLNSLNERLFLKLLVDGTVLTDFVCGFIHYHHDCCLSGDTGHRIFTVVGHVHFSNKERQFFIDKFKELKCK